MTPNVYSDLSAERSVIGSLLQDSTCLDLLDLLTPEDYTRPEYAAIHQTAAKLRAKRQPVDIQTVSSALPVELQRDAPSILLEAVRSVPSTANASHYAQIVRERSRRRAVKRICEDAIRRLEDGADTAADTAFDALRGMVGGQSTRMTAAQVASATYDMMEAIRNGELRSIPTPLPDLNVKLSGGLRKGELTVLAAYTGQGKSALAQAVTQHAAQNGYRALLVSREMSAEQYGLRAFSSLCGLDSGTMYRSKAMTGDQWAVAADAAAAFGQLPIEFTFRASTVEDVRREARSMRGIDLLVVDYIQILQTTNAYPSDNSRVAHISRTLKEIALDLQIPVLALSQFSRPPKGVAKRPRLSDLRDSGSIEQDADSVWLMWQPDGDDDPDIPPDYAGWYTAAQDMGDRFLLLDVAKQRMGSIGTIGVGFSPKRMKFYSPQMEG